MGFPQNDSLSLGFSQPEVREWLSQPELSPAVNSAVIVLGVLTFALQLCLVLFLLLRCWSYDKRVQEMLKHPETAGKLWTVPSALPLLEDFNKQAAYRLCDDEAAASSTLQPPVTPAAHRCDDLEDFEPYTNSLPAPFTAWDLVQG